jgi:predicted aspartyl protease
MSFSLKTARVEQSSASKPPFLTLGEVTHEALRSWEMGCSQFFMHKSIPEEDMVKKIAWGMQDPQIQDWYLTNQDEIDAMTFKEYMAEVRNMWLPVGWADIVRRKMLASTQGQRPFSEWAIEVQSQNTLLRGTTLHLPLYHLESHMNAELAADYHTENVVEEDLRKWIEKVRLLDEKRLCYLARQKEAVEMALRAERARYNNDKKPTAHNRFSSNGNTTTKSSGGTSKAFTRLPSLTETERQLLRDNDGCFKCQEPFAGHTSSNCSKGFPDGAIYKLLTASLVATKKVKNGKDVVAAVDVNEDSEVVAVVMPSAVLGDGTDSGEECVAPLQTPHLRWECLVDGPAVSSPITVSTLIDHGSSLVLIGEELADKLGLRCCQLAKPLPISLALSKDKNAFLLLQYVKFACTSLDQAYTSRTVRAIVALNLCTPLLLGGPFLKYNRIVIDHELRTCIAKDANYDLLQPRQSPLKDPQRRQSPWGPELLWMKRDMVNELKMVLPEWKAIIDNECEKVKEVDVVAAVQARIDGLVYQDQLKALNAKYKKKFADWFPVDIPHNNTMPSDVLFCVNLKDANKIVQLRSYDCPKKYRAAWKTLLDSPDRHRLCY